MLGDVYVLPIRYDGGHGSLRMSMAMQLLSIACIFSIFTYFDIRRHKEHMTTQLWTAEEKLNRFDRWGRRSVESA